MPKIDTMIKTSTLADLIIELDKDPEYRKEYLRQQPYYDAFVKSIKQRRAMLLIEPTKLMGHKGQFTLSGELIRDQPEAIMHLMGQMIIIKADSIWSDDAINYIAMSLLFEAGTPGLRAPHYEVEMQGDDTLCLKRLSS